FPDSCAIVDISCVIGDCVFVINCVIVRAPAGGGPLPPNPGSGVTPATCVKVSGAGLLKVVGSKGPVLGMGGVAGPPLPPPMPLFLTASFRVGKLGAETLGILILAARLVCTRPKSPGKKP
uniref:Uncharacterized protein n=1 Tax=Romanomermis culicivorax TaxID=13658 RepID=A0A915HHG2_ROMCU